MTSNISHPWPGPDERQVVAEMQNNPHSHHWHECRKFIARYLQTTDIPLDYQEDVTHDVMISVFHSLKDFRFESRFTSWLRKVADSRKLDWFRKQKRKKKVETETDPLVDAISENEDDEPTVNIKNLSGDSKPIENVMAPQNTEEECLFREVVREAKASFEEYARLHENPERIREIVDQVIFNDASQKEIAEHLGISSARVSQIVHDLQRHLREKRRGLDTEPPAPPKHPA